MSERYFDADILSEPKEEENETNKNFSEFKYNLKSEDNQYQFYCEIEDERLNHTDLKALLSYNEQKNILDECDISLIKYLIHKLGLVNTIYKVTNDIQFILDHLKNTKLPIYFNDKKISFSEENCKLDLNIYLDENSNIILDIENEDLDFIFGLEKSYVLKGNVLYMLDQTLPIKFYQEIVNKNNKFSIDTFFNIKDSLINKLKTAHNLTMDKDIEKLSNMDIEEKVAPIILEVGRSAHFVSIDLKYEIGNETFNISDYKYVENQSWLDKSTFIKINKEDNKLVKYVSDMTLSEFVMDDLFEGFRIRINRSEKNPFHIMIPISNLDTVTNRVLPRAKEMFKVKIKDGQSFELDTGRVDFEIDTMLKRNLNLFEFKVKFKIEDEYFDLEYIKNLMMQNKKFVQLKNGKTVNIENIREINKWIEFLNKFEFKRTENTYKSESTTALELDEFLRDIQGKNVTSNEEYKNMILELKEKKPVEEVEIPKVKNATLREYQKEGIYWLHFLKKYGFGGILADEMGLGKTIQTLGILAMNKGDGTHLVVCPKSLIYNWENEIEKYFPELKTLVIDKDSEKRRKLIEKCKDYDVIITSYSMLQKDYSEYIENKIKFNYMILDEAHYVKNMKTLSSKAVRTIPAQRKILLTGTPLENNLEELYGTFELIMPGYLGNKMEFRKDFVSKIERNNMIALEILQAKIRPFILRRTKKEVLKELPDKQEQVVYNEMTNKQAAIYNEVLNRVKNEVNELIQAQGIEKSRIQVLSALLKLRQICNHPALLDKSFNGELDISGKYEQFLELMGEVIDGGDKVLVFSQFTSMLDIFEKDLANKKINYLRLDGSTKNRQEVVDEFNNNENIKVFLISLKAGGVGLNLTSANAVFLYDPWWNPMAEKQAVDRAHRIGQKNTVNIYKFITKNSIEEKILKLQERKGNLFENLVTENTDFFKRLEWEDLMELFD